MAPPAARLAQRFRPNFSESVRRHGGTFLASGGVRVVESSPESFRGAVGGAEAAEALLQIEYRGEGADLSMSCTCSTVPANPCKHLWGLLLAADECGWGRSLVATDGWDDDADDADADEDEEDPDESSRTAWATRSRGQLPERTVPPDWRSLLANLDVTTAAELEARGASEPGAASDHERWLVINTGETLAKQQLHLDCMERRRKLNGEWAMLKPAVCTMADFVPQRSDAHSSVIRTLLSATPASRQAASYGRAESGRRRFESLVFDPDMDRAWWRALSAEVKLGIASQTAAGRQVLPALLDEASPWTDEIDVRRASNGRDWTISILLKRDDGVSVRLDEPLVVFPSGLVIFKDSLAWMRPRTPAAFQWIALLRRSPRLAIPDAQLDPLIAKILALQTPPRINWSAEAVAEGRAWTEDSPPPTPILRLSRGALSIQRGHVVALTLAFAYGPSRVDGTDPREVLALDRARHLLRRDMRAEKRHVEHLIERSGQLVARADPGFLTVPAEALVKVIERAEQDGWAIELERARVRSPTTAVAHVSSGVDWFDLQADCRFEDQAIGLPALLAAIEEKSPFVRLDDGSLGMLPSAWIERLAAFSLFGSAKDGGLRFDKSQISILDCLLDELPDVRVDECFAALRAKVNRFEGIQAAPPPAAFVGALRPYQCEGLGWLQFLRDFGFGGCLADDMGLGKTIQVLAALPGAGRATGPTLVVVPRSLVHNWGAEAAKFRPDLRVLNYDTSDRKRAEAILPGYDLIVMTYGCLRRDITRLRKIAFDGVILDEAQIIKNRDSQTARAARLLQAPHRLALSGTPVENRVEELLSIFAFLNPGLITPGMFRRVRARNASEHALHELLGKALRPFVLRRTKEQVLRDLPEKTEQTIFCELDAGQREKYEELRRYYQSHLMDTVAKDGLAPAKFHVLEALLRLRQAACHPGLLDEARGAEPSAKLDALVEHLVDVAQSGHKALVFSQFTSFLAIVRARLEREGVRYEYLDGKTSDRERRVRRFQTDASIPVFLISLKAGGVGLNLTAAEYCFILDPWWNPAVEAQAIARAHRIGQTKPVFAYRLIARGTVEEKILELQASKRGLADAIVNGDNASLSKMSLDDLRFLLD